MQLVITPVGDVRCLYDESLDLSSLGSVRIQRGSAVEPDFFDQWFADLSPVGGPRLGPFPRRSDALSAEVAWLRDHWLVPVDQIRLTILFNREPFPLEIAIS